MVVERVKDAAHKWRLTIGYLLLVVGLVVATTIAVRNQDRIEERAQIATAQNCEVGNEIKDILRDMLLIMVGSPERDGYERRLQTFAQIEPLLEHNDCPPTPPYDQYEE